MKYKKPLLIILSSYLVATLFCIYFLLNPGQYAGNPAPTGIELIFASILFTAIGTWWLYLGYFFFLIWKKIQSRGTWMYVSFVVVTLLGSAISWFAAQMFFVS